MLRKDPVWCFQSTSNSRTATNESKFYACKKWPVLLSGCIWLVFVDHQACATCVPRRSPLHTCSFHYLIHNLSPDHYIALIALLCVSVFNVKNSELKSIRPVCKSKHEKSENRWVPTMSLAIMISPPQSQLLRPRNMFVMQCWRRWLRPQWLIKILTTPADHLHIVACSLQTHADLQICMSAILSSPRLTTSQPCLLFHSTSVCWFQEGPRRGWART